MLVRWKGAHDDTWEAMASFGKKQRRLINRMWVRRTLQGPRAHFDQQLRPPTERNQGGLSRSQAPRFKRLVNGRDYRLAERRARRRWAQVEMPTPSRKRGVENVDLDNEPAAKRGRVGAPVVVGDDPEEMDLRGEAWQRPWREWREAAAQRGRNVKQRTR